MLVIGCRYAVGLQGMACKAREPLVVFSAKRKADVVTDLFRMKNFAYAPVAQIVLFVLGARDLDVNDSFQASGDRPLMECRIVNNAQWPGEPSRLLAGRLQY